MIKKLVLIIIMGVSFCFAIIPLSNANEQNLSANIIAVPSFGATPQLSNEITPPSEIDTSDRQEHHPEEFPEEYKYGWIVAATCFVFVVIAVVLFFATRGIKME